MSRRVEILGLLLLQLRNLLKMRLEFPEVRLGPGFSPRNRGLRRRPLQLFYQFRRNLPVIIKLSLDNPDNPLFGIVQSLLLISFLDEACEIESHPLAEKGELRTNFAPGSSARLRHVDFKVPLEERRGIAHGRDRPVLGQEIDDYRIAE